MRFKVLLLVFTMGAITIVALALKAWGTRSSPTPDPQTHAAVLSPEAMYAACLGSAGCPPEPVIIEGNLKQSGRGVFTLQAETRAIYLKFSSGVLLRDQLRFVTENQLVKGGTVFGRVAGKPYRTLGFCTNDGCESILEMFIQPADFTFVRRVGCEDAERGGYFNGVDCFDFGAERISLLQAYDRLVASDLFRRLGYELTGLWLLPYAEDESWRFQASTPASLGGCSSYYRVGSNLEFTRRCTDQSRNLTEVEPPEPI